MKIKENEKKKINKYLDLNGEQKELWNLRMMVIPMLSGTSWTFPKELENGMKELEIRGRMEIIQTTS